MGWGLQCSFKVRMCLEKQAGLGLACLGRKKSKGAILLELEPSLLNLSKLQLVDLGSWQKPV